MASTKEYLHFVPEQLSEDPYPVEANGKQIIYTGCH